VKVILGRFKNKLVNCGVTACAHANQRWFRIPEEKRTDVNIAESMVDNACQNRCDHLVLISGDSDLVPGCSSASRALPPGRKLPLRSVSQPDKVAAVELDSTGASLPVQAKCGSILWMGYARRSSVRLVITVWWLISSKSRSYQGLDSDAFLLRFSTVHMTPI